MSLPMSPRMTPPTPSFLGLTWHRRRTGDAGSRASQHCDVWSRLRRDGRLEETQAAISQLNGRERDDPRITVDDQNGGRRLPSPIGQTWKAVAQRAIES